MNVSALSGHLLQERHHQVVTRPRRYGRPHDDGVVGVGPTEGVAHRDSPCPEGAKVVLAVGGGRREHEEDEGRRPGQVDTGVRRASLTAQVGNPGGSMSQNVTSWPWAAKPFPVAVPTTPAPTTSTRAIPAPFSAHFQRAPPADQSGAESTPGSIVSAPSMWKVTARPPGLTLPPTGNGKPRGPVGRNPRWPAPSSVRALVGCRGGSGQPDRPAEAPDAEGDAEPGPRPLVTVAPNDLPALPTPVFTLWGCAPKRPRKATGRRNALRDHRAGAVGGPARRRRQRGARDLPRACALLRAGGPAAPHPAGRQRRRRSRAMVTGGSSS